MEEFRSVLSRLPVVLMSRVARGRPKEGEIDTTWVAAIYTQMTFPPSFSVLAAFFHLFLFLFSSFSAFLVHFTAPFSLLLWGGSQLTKKM